MRFIIIFIRAQTKHTNTKTKSPNSFQGLVSRFSNLEFPRCIFLNRMATSNWPFIHCIWAGEIYSAKVAWSFLIIFEFHLMDSSWHRPRYQPTGHLFDYTTRDDARIHLVCWSRQTIDFRGNKIIGLKRLFSKIYIEKKILFHSHSN